VERFLQLAARGNIQVCQPSTPAQYFHLLRRQVLREEVKPLIVLTPKSLLRLKESSSTAEELTNGTFEDVLDDPASGSLSGVRRVVLTTSKVYFEIEAARRERGSVDIALLRLEQFYPFPGERISTLLRRYPEAKDVVWVQEEPRNMGAFGFLLDRVAPCLAPGQTLRYVGRPRNSSPATGSTRRHLAEQKALSDAALSGEPAAVTISKLST
jgi:2-oxoglutarate dehydrogenase E1 component